MVDTVAFVAFICLYIGGSVLYTSAPTIPKFKLTDSIPGGALAGVSTS